MVQNRQENLDYRMEFRESLGKVEGDNIGWVRSGRGAQLLVKVKHFNVPQISTA